jgi:hypothetical protein
MPEIDEIADQLRTFFRTRGSPTLGAQVGGFLKTNFPTFYYRTKYASLKQFLEAAIPGETRVVGKHGPDDIFEFIASGNVSAEVQQTPLAPETDLYELFRNPTVNGYLVYNRSDRALSKCDQVKDTDEIAIERISHTDQRAMMIEFIDIFKDRDDLPGPNAVPSVEDPFYWQKFYLLIQRANLVQRWAAFRKEKIEILLQERLNKLDLPEEEKQTLLSRVLHSAKPVVRRSQVATGSQNLNYQVAKPRSIQQLALAAVSRLSEAQIRELKVPLGAIWDSLNSH